MTFEQLAHLIQVCCEHADVYEIVVFGSQSVLGAKPDPGPEFTASMEADVYVRNDPAKTEAIDVNLGEGSPFHEKHGYYAQGGDPADFAHLPTGWEERTVKIGSPYFTDGRIGHCLSLTDLFLSKASAGREKDRPFCQAMLTRGFVDGKEMLAWVPKMPLDGAAQDTLIRRIRRWAKDVGMAI
ncbi:MAG: hypothetical protein JO006_02015 [Paucibacter sp.]|nr:hypothetical protein [Roseateles sp.]